MFDMGKEAYKTDIKLGQKYVDQQTSIEGVATAIHFFQHACERVTLEFLKKDGSLEELTFDAPRLRLKAKPEEPVRQTRTGGPARAGEGVRGRLR